MQFFSQLFTTFYNVTNCLQSNQLFEKFLLLLIIPIFIKIYYSQE